MVKSNSELQWPEYISSDGSKGTLSDYLTGAVGVPNQATLVQAGFVAASCQSIVTGAVIFFVVRYYQLCKSDTRMTKAFVAAMTVLAIIEMIITDVDVGRLVTHMGNYAKVFRSNQILSLLSVFINGFSTLFMQLSFVRRAYILWGRRWQVGLGLGLLSLGTFAAINFAFAAGLTCPIYDEHTTRQDALASMPDFARYGDLFFQSSRSQSVLLLVSDFSITLAIIAGLWKSRTGFKRTDSLVMRLVIAITESMIAPLVLGVAYVIFIVLGNGPSSWLRVPASMQSAIYLHAVVCSLLLRTREPAFQAAHVSSNHIVSRRAAPFQPRTRRISIDDKMDEEMPEVEFYVTRNASSKNTVSALNRDDNSSI